MNLIKRAYYSVRNNLSKSLVLFAIVFIIGNVMCASLAITNSIENTQNEFRKHYGEKVEIEIMESLSIRDIYKNGSSDLMKRVYEYLNNLVTNNQEVLQYLDMNTAISGFYSNELKYVDENEEVSGDMSVYLFGTSNPNMGLIKNYKIELIEGRLFSEEEMEKGSKVILISENFQIEKDGNYQKVEIGDVLEFERRIVSTKTEEVLYTEKAEYEVIGIYKRYDNVMVENEQYAYENHMARIYAPLNAIKEEEARFAQLNEEIQYDMKNINNTMMTEKVYFQLKSDVSMNRFEVALNTLKENDPSVFKELSVTSTNDIYKKISGPIESMSEIASFLFIMSSILCVLILSVAIFILIKNRKHEVGILISLGETKSKVILQILLEIMTVGMLALGCSMVSGNQIGKFYSNMLIQEQMETSKDSLTVDEAKLQEELIENYSFEMSKEYVIGVVGTGSVVLLLSVVVPIGYIVRLKPKKILL